jgi:peptidoglycan/LPS O-acetylase OafA/YrhL
MALPTALASLLTLDGIRGMAAVLFVLRHTSAYFGRISFQETYLGVDVFFVLSGVVIANTYEATPKGGSAVSA